MIDKTKKTFSRDKTKVNGIKRLLNSFKYSYEGIKYAFIYEQSMTIHIIMSLIVLIIGIIVKLDRIEWCISIILIGLVIGSELINTSIEAAIDVTCIEINPVAKIAKDTAAAAVLIFVFVAIIVGLMIFVPKIYEIFQSLI